MTGAWRERATGRRWVFALAALALLLQVLAPQGFMLSGQASSPGLVICTGHGPLLSHTGHGKPDKAPKSADGSCVFAVHGAAAGPPAPVLVAAAPYTFAAAASLPTFDAAPGRGLAAPPPPSHAPPAPLV
jgi:hypothetical protein